MPYLAATILLWLLTGCSSDAGSMSSTRSILVAEGLLVVTPPGISTWDGDKLTKIAHPPEGKQDDTPSWTPDGGIIFISDRGGSRQIWKRSIGGALAQVGNLPPEIQARQPQQGRNGIIVFAAITPKTVLLPDMHHPSNLTLYRMRADGSGLMEIGPGKSPSLSPSGLWLVYAHQVDDPYHHQIWRINVDSTGAQQLTFLTDPDYPDANAPSISPDETKIAFFSGKEQDIRFEIQPMWTYGYRNIAVIPAMGGPRQTITNCKPVTNIDELRVTKSCILADEPDWLGSDTLIFNHMAKNASDQVVSETWKINLDGSGLARYYDRVRGVVPVAIKR